MCGGFEHTLFLTKDVTIFACGGNPESQNGSNTCNRRIIQKIESIELNCFANEVIIDILKQEEFTH